MRKNFINALKNLSSKYGRSAIFRRQNNLTKQLAYLPITNNWKKIPKKPWLIRAPQQQLSVIIMLYPLPGFKTFNLKQNNKNLSGIAFNIKNDII